jgi:hypothetical protein
VVDNIGRAQTGHEIEFDDRVIVERRGGGEIKLRQPSMAGRCEGVMGRLAA